MTTPAAVQCYRKKIVLHLKKKKKDRGKKKGFRCDKTDGWQMRTAASLLHGTNSCYDPLDLYSSVSIALPLGSYLRNFFFFFSATHH